MSVQLVTPNKWYNQRELFSAIRKKGSNMSERTGNPMNQTAPLASVPQPSCAPSIPAGTWAKLQAEIRELKAQEFGSREQVLAWLRARGYEDGEQIWQRLQAGGEI